MPNIINEIHQEIKKLSANPANVKDYSRFHKDGKKHIGLASAITRRLYVERFKQVKPLGKKQIFTLCDKLLQTKNTTCRGMVFDWAFRLRKQYTEKDFSIFEKWLDKYVDTWGSCDDLCTHALGYHLIDFPKATAKIRAWTKEKNKWKRRAAAVIFVQAAGKGKFLTEILRVATLLLRDPEDLVQKGYGWMLKEASLANPRAIFAFIMKHKRAMPRVALRYAIEKMPPSMKKQAMA